VRGACALQTDGGDGGIDRCWRCGLLALMFSALVAGCTIGPSTMTGPVDYTAPWPSRGRARSVKPGEAPLYDTPVFLDVGDRQRLYGAEHFTGPEHLNTTAGAGVPNTDRLGAQANSPTDDHHLRALMGERFARSLMTPIPPPAILSLIQAGYPIDLCCAVVHTLNGIRIVRWGARRRPADRNSMSSWRARDQDSAPSACAARVGREEARS